MSRKDMLGPLVRALAALPVQYHGITLDVVNKLAGQDGAAMKIALTKTLREVMTPKFTVSPEGTITFSVTSDGTTGAQWITRLKDAGHKVSDYAEQRLRSPEFVLTNGVTTQVVVLPGKLWKDGDRLIKNVRLEAVVRKSVMPNAETACLIRIMFTNEEIRSMGFLRIVTMHEPIKDAVGYPVLLTVNADVDGSWLYAYWDYPDYQWHSQNGFAFALPQV